MGRGGGAVKTYWRESIKNILIIMKLYSKNWIPKLKIFFSFKCLITDKPNCTFVAAQFETRSDCFIFIYIYASRKGGARIVTNLSKYNVFKDKVQSANIYFILYAVSKLFKWEKLQKHDYLLSNFASFHCKMVVPDLSIMKNKNVLKISKGQFSKKKLFFFSSRNCK